METCLTSGSTQKNTETLNAWDPYGCAPVDPGLAPVFHPTKTSGSVLVYGLPSTRRCGSTVLRIIGVIILSPQGWVPVERALYTMIEVGRGPPDSG